MSEPVLCDSELERMFGNVLDLDKPPKIPLGWGFEAGDQLASCIHLGQRKIEPGIVDCARNTVLTTGYLTIGYVKDTQNATAHLLDYYYANQHLIPVQWSPLTLYAWTIFRDDEGKQCLRCLFKNGNRWYYGKKRLSQQFLENELRLVYNTPA